MKLRYCCTHWGQEHLDAHLFLQKLTEAGYGGVEICLPESTVFTTAFMVGVDRIRRNDPGFILIPQLILSPDQEGIAGLVSRTVKKLPELASCEPSFINAHTGKDYFSFDDNCRLIETGLNFTAKTGIRILHETHRGRFSFHGQTLLAYLEKFPELELVGDLSHFCTVSESLLDDQSEILAAILPKIAHLHARVGSEQGPQVNHPFAPEWSHHLHCFTAWWKEIIRLQYEKKKKYFSITPEAGPAPYMPAMPFSKQPLTNQWEINIAMMQYLQKEWQQHDLSN